MAPAGARVGRDAQDHAGRLGVARHPGLEDLRDPDEEAPEDREAREAGLTFIKLDGSIGCMVNGAGLAMTTMDLVKRAGGEPANFLDIGGGARADKVAHAMRLILSDPKSRRSWSTSSGAHRARGAQAVEARPRDREGDDRPNGRDERGEAATMLERPIPDREFARERSEGGRGGPRRGARQSILGG